MAPANQGSKAALITWTVVATVFGIVMTVLALLFFANANTYRQDLERAETEYGDVVARADLAGTQINELRDAAQREGQAGSVFNYLLYREQQLAGNAAGTSDYTSATSAIERKLSELASAEQPITATSLLGAVDQLQGQLNSLRQEMAGLQQANADLQTTLQNQQAQAQQQLAAKDAAIESLNQQTQEATAQLTEFQQAATDVTTKVDTVIAEMAQGSAQSQESLQNQISDLRTQNEQLTQQLHRVTEILRSRHGGDQMLASPDGQVLRSPSEGRLYINLGRNNSITNGMTFEVYDSVTGIPQMQSAESLPKGKGSIQVIRVLPNSAEARVIATTPGQVIREGDLIANLAYDPNVPIRFRIYGDFDLNNDGRIDERDRDRVESLVREFGGEIVPQVTVETDLLVMGKEPVLPEFSEEERRLDGQKAAAYERARQRLEAYRNVISQAQALNIPILNQNQFLYYIGYFDQSRR